MDAPGGEQIGSRKGVAGSNSDLIGKTGRRRHGLLREAENHNAQKRGSRPRDAEAPAGRVERNANISLTTQQTYFSRVFKKMWGDVSG